MRDHGGNLDAAIARFGGAAEYWIDLSTGINRSPYPLAPLPDRAARALPSAEDLRACARAACFAYAASPEADCLPLAGAQAAIRLLPALRPPGRACVLGPTYSEHAAAFAAAGWAVTEVRELAAVRGFDAAVLVNPNNPDGRRWPPEEVLALRAANGLVIVDESFADVDPGVSVCGRLGPPGLLVLRSFGKFYGLAGLRLGFILGAEGDVGRVRAMAGPWPVSGPALAAGQAALADAPWVEATRSRLTAGARRLDRLAAAAGWRSVGGTTLFRLYDAGEAATEQERLAQAHIWSRVFAYSRAWIRLGLPGAESEWNRLTAVLA